MAELQLIHTDLLPSYLEEVGALHSKFEALHDAEISTDAFSFFTSVASVFSSKIEGEQVELDSYIKHKAWGIKFQPDYTRKIDDLYEAYLFAQSHPLTEENIRQAHRLLARNLVEKRKLGQWRTQNMYVADDEGKIEYVAASPYHVPAEMGKWLVDLAALQNQMMQTEEAFFYASRLHLTFMKTHPWNDGNGRSGRLIEKWFLAEKLGPKAWFLQSEKNYYLHHALYYQNLRRLGLEYPELDYAKALPFLTMLPQSLNL